MPLGLAGRPTHDRSTRARELLERVGLLDRADARPSELSGGEQQRIALCAALANHPRLLIADEPTGDLDAESAHEVLALLSELVAEQRSAAIVVSHDPASTEIADRVVHIRDGRVSEESHGGAETAVVGAGGWLRISEEALRAAGIYDRARVVVRDGSVELHPVDGRVAAAPTRSARLQGGGGRVLEARGVSRRYGAQLALDQLDATFLPGELSVVVGPSGSASRRSSRSSPGSTCRTRAKSASGRWSCRSSTTPVGPRSAGHAQSSVRRPVSPASCRRERTSSSPSRCAGSRRRARRAGDGGLAAVGLAAPPIVASTSVGGPTRTRRPREGFAAARRS